jgi:hypothetical protein
VIPLNLDEVIVHEISHILACPVGVLPFRYLGVPLHFEWLKREDLQPILDKLIKRCARWRGRLLACSSKLVLIKSCLVSIPVYLLSFIKFSKWAIKLLESQMAHCLWNDGENSNKYHLASWRHVTMKKEFGGLGVPDLRKLNLYLLASWVKRYSMDEGKFWKRLVDFKYMTCSPNILACRDLGVSNFWKGVMWAAQAARIRYKWKVGCGRKVRFWENMWLGTSSLAIHYWELYCIVNEKSGTIAELWDGVNLKCTFRRCVNLRLMNLWEEVVEIASSLVLSDEEDELI